MAHAAVAAALRRHGTARPVLWLGCVAPTRRGAACCALAAAIVLAACGASRSTSSSGGASPTAQTQPVPRAEEPGDALRIRGVMSRALRDFGDAFEARSVRRVTEMLAADFEDAARFEDALTEFFRQAGELRILLRESSSNVRGNRATMIADAEMIYAPRVSPAAERRRKNRIQFDFVLTARGWEITNITPREFFTAP